jgi:hypothetical protein
MSRRVRIDIELGDLKHEIGVAQRHEKACCNDQEIRLQAGINLQQLGNSGRNISCRIIRVENDPCLTPFLARSTQPRKISE